ncbi:hypothetical protein K402DRAFT_398233 [Aulographum hederae CBS 113979]|uniref:CUE domain-containing protein n=1 Tax=Aulographum hederae CBS 113979 TaxID=1176131 RepID=A0A6G1GLJ7_9PEZI|nr:hypothetical protein K402DRAFT_398233 [Aulographum hederae CBS 113979]
MASQQTPNQPPQYGQPLQNHPQRTDTDLLPKGQERSEQIEYMQAHEASRPQTHDEKNQETLQRQFPNVDASLIAALYSDNKDMSELRETLQELSSQQS